MEDQTRARRVGIFVFVTFIVGSLVLSFWILPVMVMACTPFKYRDIVGVCKDAMVTGFTTGNLFIVLPLLIENCKRLLEDYELTKPDTGNLIDVIIPVSFNSSPSVLRIRCLLRVVANGNICFRLRNFLAYFSLRYSCFYSFLLGLSCNTFFSDKSDKTAK